MSALSKDLDTPQRVGELFEHPVAAGAVLYAGGIGCLNGGGFAVPGTAAVNLSALGRIEEFVDNALGTDGDMTVSVRRGVFQYANSATNPVTRLHINGPCYIEDDQTVGSLATGMTAAGTVLSLDADGVWVEIQ